MSSVQRPPVRGRPRSGDADRSILTATLELLAADGFTGLTMGAVIARAGTSSATLYRRWPTKNELVAAALASMTGMFHTADTGSLVTDLSDFVARIADADCLQPDALGGDVLVELGRHEELFALVGDKIVAPRIAALDALLSRARDRGEVSSDVDTTTIFSLISGPVHHRTHVLGQPADSTFLRAVATGALATISARTE